MKVTLTDTLSWMCKALAKSRMKKYASTLDTIINGAGSENLKRYAENYIRYLK